MSLTIFLEGTLSSGRVTKTSVYVTISLIDYMRRSACDPADWWGKKQSADYENGML